MMPQRGRFTDRRHPYPAVGPRARPVSVRPKREPAYAQRAIARADRERHGRRDRDRGARRYLRYERLGAAVELWRHPRQRALDAAGADRVRNVGAVTSAIVFQALASRTGMSAEDVEQHARDCCRQIEFHPSAWRYAQKRGRPQALVTVNPDLFVSYVVPLHALTAVFDVIIVSATERCANKVELCEEALPRTGFAGDRSEALLIDNRADLVRAWKESGGAGYWFRTDEEFGRDMPALLDEVR
jgi:hypothetical protein